jgi:predicted protein tyrosine phosphatase
VIEHGATRLHLFAARASAVVRPALAIAAAASGGMRASIGALSRLQATTQRNSASGAPSASGMSSSAAKVSPWRSESAATRRSVISGFVIKASLPVVRILPGLGALRRRTLGIALGLGFAPATSAGVDAEEVMTTIDDTPASGAPLVPYRLTICGLGELAGFANAGVSHVLSILDPEWPEPEAFRLFAPHRRVVQRFDDVLATIGDAEPPEVGHVDAILRWAGELADDGADHVLVHCHAGVSRSTAAAALLLARDNPGREADALDAVRRLRPRSWPNSRMVAIADRLLDREGALIAALQDHRRRVAADNPEFGALLAGGDPAHEVLGTG